MPAKSLSERIKQFNKNTKNIQATLEQQKYQSRATRMQRDITSINIFATQLLATLCWLYKYVCKPVQRQSFRFGKYLLWRYRQLWAYTVYRRDKYGSLVFSKSRAAGFLAGSIIFIWFIFWPAIGLLSDTVLYLLTTRVDEIVYLNGSQEIYSGSNAHNIEGCSHLPCSDTDALYYRAEDSWFNNLWSVFHGHGLYWPEYVAAAVPYNISRCIIT